MKKTLIIFFLLALFLVFPKVSEAQETGWNIENLDSQINLLENGKVSVKETINVDYKLSPHHGIFRDLVYKKDSTDNKKHYISYEIGQVLLDGSPEQYSTSYQSEFFEIKIGNPSKTLTGKHTYQINYLAAGIIGSFSDHDELYWNVTGNYWTIPILSSKASVTLPKDGIINITCYQGVLASTNPCTPSLEGKSIATFQSTRTLNSAEGMSLVVGFTKGLVPILEGNAPPAFNLDIIDVLIFSLICLITFFVVFYLWWEKGRDNWFKRRYIDDPNTTDEVKPIGGHDTIVVEYDPPEKLRPGEMGQILFEDLRPVALTATLVDLAVRGYLQIKEEEKGLILKTKDYTFIKQNKDWGDVLPYEKSLLEGIFANLDFVSLSDLKKTLYQATKEVKDKINQEMVDKKYFKENPGKVKSRYGGIGATLFIIPFIAFSVSSLQNIFQHEIAVLLAMVVSGAIFVVFGLFMSARTAAGHEMKNRILGYKLFISTAEKYRQQFFERQNMFNEILPYAILFGVTEKFTKAFSDLGMKPPQTNWYVGAAAFNAATFSNSMSAFAGSFNSSMSSTSGFSGGGAGGGGGGGGGGGW